MPTASTDTDALRVLVVDDSAPLRERVCVALTLAGLTVVGEACDGAHALVQAAQQHPDVRVVLWSGDSDDQLADAVWHSGAHAGLAKGTRTSELIATLRRVCASRPRTSWDPATAT